MKRDDLKFNSMIDKNIKEFLLQKAFGKLRNTRIVRFDLVYVRGIPIEIAKEKILRSKQFLGQYGTIK